MGRDRHKPPILLCVLGIIPTIWIALIAAPALASGGLPEMLTALPNALEQPFNISWHENSLQTVLIFVAAYVMGITLYLASRKNKRPGEEHGSARWGDPYSINRKYAVKKFAANKILTQLVRMSFKVHKHKRNLNFLVVGGSGASKTRGYAKPNILSANTSFIALDPKGELARDTGRALEAKGYEVRILDLINMHKSHCYNPFVYLSDDNDIQRLVTNLFKSVTPKGASPSEPYWDDSAQMLLMALVCYLHYLAPPDEQNFAMVMEMLRAADMPDVGDGEGDGGYRSPTDELFDKLETKDADHIALRYYKSYRGAPSKTLKSIQSTLASKLLKFNLDSLAALTITDELELEKMGERKTALFAIIPDNDSSFNFIVSMLYTQLFQQLIYSADHKHGGTLPVHVHFVMDEFANIALPDDFEKIVSVIRSRGISVSIILQNLSQLKALFEKSWESIVGNCDTFLYLGGNEQSTHEYVSKLMGRENLDTNTYGKSCGRSGSFSTNYQTSGRELLTADEVRMLDNNYAILFIRGERPVMDKKFDLTKHPNVCHTPDCRNASADLAYHHGESSNSLGRAAIAWDIDPATLPELTEEDIPDEYAGFELYSEEDLEQLFLTTSNKQ